MLLLHASKEGTGEVYLVDPVFP